MANPKSKSTNTGIAPSYARNWLDFDKSIENLRKEMEKAFSSFPSFKMTSMPQLSQTSCDVIDEGNQYRVKLDVPGVKKNEIKLEVTDNSIEVSAEHKESSEEKKKNYLRRERSQVSYYRSLPLDENVISGEVKAKLVDGVLEITLPKSKQAKVSKKQSIQVQ